ncbi:MAG: hypothetical protein Q8O46_00665 [bacterium]|nr:hypothetical protein [bacterium]
MASNKKLFNKKLWQALFLFLFSVQILLLGADTIYAQATCGPALGIACNPVEGTISSIPEAIIIIIRYLLFIIGLVSMFYIVIAGIKYMASFGEEDKMRSAKETFSSSATGLAIALAAYGILEVIVRILNKNS